MFAGSQKALQKLFTHSTLTLPSLCRAISCGRSLNIKSSNVKNDPSGLAFNTAFDFDESKISIDTIKSEFCHLGGGSISLKKDNVTGIAQLQLVNSQMKNAYSGKMMCDLNDAMIELENWEEGKGLWMIIGLAMIAVTFSIWSDKYLDSKNYKHRIGQDYWL